MNACIQQPLHHRKRTMAQISVPPFYKVVGSGLLNKRKSCQSRQRRGVTLFLVASLVLCLLPACCSQSQPTGQTTPEAPNTPKDRPEIENLGIPSLTAGGSKEKLHSAEENTRGSPVWSRDTTALFSIPPSQENGDDSTRESTGQRDKTAAADTGNPNVLIVCGRSTCDKRALENAAREAMERAANDRYRYKTQGVNGDFGNPDKVFQGQSQGPENPQAGARKNTEEVWAQTGSQPFHVSLFYGEELRKLTDEHAEGETRRQRVVDGAADPSKRNDPLRSEADDQTAKAEENQGNTHSGSDTRRDAQTRERVQLSESLEGAENRSPPPQPGDRFLSPSRKFPTFAASGFPRPDDSASASATTSPLPSDASTFQSSEGHRSLRLSPSRASALDKPAVDRTDGGEEGTGKGSMPKPMHTKHDFKGRSFHGSAVTQVRYVLWGNSSQGSDETATPSSFEDEKSQPTSEEENKGEGKVRKNVESVCTVDGATLHHLSCEVIRLHACYTVIDPHLLATYLREAPCVESVGFDQQAAPCIVEEETKPLFVPSLRPLHDDSEPLTEFSFPAVFSASDDTAGFRELVSDTWVERRKELLGNKGEDGIKREEENQPEDPEDVEEEKHRWRGPRDSSYADAWTKVVRRFKGLPNDPLLLWLPQWELLNRVTGVDASLAWKRTKGGSGSIEEQPANTIALVDFGFQLNHEDLWHKWWRNAQVGAVTGTAEWPDNCADGIDNDENGYVDDCFGFSFADSGGSQRSLLGKHGTAVASHCCAGTNNALGVASVGWNLRPMALRVDGSYSQIAEAVNYAADKGVKVINLSLGGPASPILRRMVEQADKRNITLVVAAGNHRCDLGQIEERGCRSDDGSLKGYPAAYSDTFLNMISVGATDKEGRVASFTNFDSSPAHDRIQVMAPGRELPSCSDGKDANNEYLSMSGTSFASPIVAAIVGLLRLKRPDLPPRAVRSLLVNSCKVTDDASLASHCECGGVVSAERALKLAGIGQDRAPEPQHKSAEAAQSEE
ncbi:subtilisin SUB5 [Toxoplasma gondii VAND]|uniref:subtilisin n=1 Tax=Toxoplasma gondii VAND TaxID=933077 RepID=A0A086PVA6_TOXGO|nr:subtilisin SUB5 [Toxoplasma gondii VAND]